MPSVFISALEDQMRKSLIAAVSAMALTMPSAALLADEAETEAGAETGVEAEIEADAEMTPESESDAEAGAETGAEADADMDADADMEADMEADSEAGAEEVRLTDLEIEALVGMAVESSNGESIGEVEDVVTEDVVTEEGGQRVLISTGGLLGIGADTKAVSVTDIDFDEDGDVAVVTMTEAEFEELPDYEGQE